MPVGLEPPYSIGDNSVQLVPRTIGGYYGGAAEVIGSGAIQSKGFVTGGALGWIIRGDGTFELAGGTFRGDIVSDNWDGSFPGFSATAGWGLDYDTGDAEFAGTLVAQNLTTGPSGSARLWLSDGSQVGGSNAGIWFDTGDSDQDVGSNIIGHVVGTDGSTEVHAITMFGAQAYNHSHNSAGISIRTESEDGTSSPQLILLYPSSTGSAQGGIILYDHNGPSAGGSYYYGWDYSAATTYMLLSTRVDFWNFEYVRFNNMPVYVDTDLYVGGSLYFGASGANDRITYAEGTNTYTFEADAGLAAIKAATVYFAFSTTDDYLAFDDTTNIFYFGADSAAGYVAAGAYYFGSNTSNDHISFDDTNNYYQFTIDGIPRLRLRWDGNNIMYAYPGYEGSGIAAILQNTSGTTYVQAATYVYIRENAAQILAMRYTTAVEIVGALPGLMGTFRSIGYLTSNGQWCYSTSSSKYKKDITPRSVMEADVMDLKPKRYRYDKTKAPAHQHPDSVDEIEQLGFVVEDLAEVDPKFVGWEYSEKQPQLLPLAHLPEDHPQYDPEDTETQVLLPGEGDLIPSNINIDAIVSHLVTHVQALTLEVEELKRIAGRPVLRDVA